MRLNTIIAVLVVATLGLAACGSDDNSSSASVGTTAATSLATQPPTSSAAISQFNDADVAFAQGMIPHHEQAVQMADIALDSTVGSSERVLDLARRIKAAQDPEIQLMSGWLQAWGHPMTTDATTGTAMHNMGSTGGMMTDEEMTALRAAKGADFDKMWTEMMIRHHEGAIAMAETEKTSGSNPDALALADTIVTAQQGEITEMKALLGAE